MIGLGFASRAAAARDHASSGRGPARPRRERGGRRPRPFRSPGAAAVVAASLAAGAIAASAPAASADQTACANVSAGSWSALQSAFAGASDSCVRITLTADIPAADTAGESLKVGTTPITLNLGGHDLAITSPPVDDAAIGVPADGSLTIEDVDGDGRPLTTGTLTATGAGEAAGIGGGGADGPGTWWRARSGGAAGAVTINGGTVIATGGSNGSDQVGHGAGIGGGGGGHAGNGDDLSNTNPPAGGTGGEGGTVIINGGVVSATGRQGAGIGGGGAAGGGVLGAESNAAGGIGGEGGTVTIHGGDVRATGGHKGAGLGGSGAGIGGGGGGFGAGAGLGYRGGTGGNSGAVTIDGGTTRATGGEGTTATGGLGAGIGGGEGGTGGPNGGGGSGGNSGPVTFGGGDVAAIGSHGAGIGGGAGGTGGTGTGGGSGGNSGPVTFDAPASAPFVLRGPFDGAGGQPIGGGTGGGPGPGGSGIGHGGNGSSTSAGLPGSWSNEGALVIPTGAFLTVPDSPQTATNGGTIQLAGTLDGTGTLPNSGSILPAAGSTISGPEITIDNYALTFDLGGATGIQPPDVTVYAPTIGRELPPLAPRLGHVVGWYTRPVGGDLITASTDLPSTFGPGPRSVTLYARRAPVPETVSFDSRGGSAIPPQTVPYGQEATAPAAPSRPGHTFAGWYTTPTGRSAYNFDTPITGSLTLYARWTLATATTSPEPPAPAPPAVKDPEPTAKLTLRMDASSPRVRPGGRIRYRLVIRNRGNGTARDLQLCDVLPAHLTVAGTKRRRAKARGKLRDGKVCWTVKRLKPRARVVRTLLVRVDDEARPGRIVNRATVDSSAVKGIDARARRAVRAVQASNPKPVPAAPTSATR